MDAMKGFLRMHARALYDLLRQAQNNALSKRHSAMAEADVSAELARMYKRRIGREPDFESPRRYTEKIQWRKLHGLTPEMARLSDKYAVRKWVADRIGDEYLVSLFGRWAQAADIDFDALPQEFVLKTNNGSSTNIIVRDRSKLDVADACKRLDEWMAYQMGWVYFERQYNDIVPCIIAEEMLHPAAGENDLRDYKFLCFDGEPLFVWVDIDRYTNHTRAMFDTNWNLQNWNQYNYPPSPYVPERPACLDEMLRLARKLSAGFDHVRVDLYEVDGKVYFGEMTFTNGSGFERIVPDEYDEVLGGYWTLPKPVEKKALE